MQLTNPCTYKKNYISDLFTNFKQTTDMKNRIILFCVVIFVNASVIAQNTATSAESIVTNAVGRAAVEKKKTMIIFHASWCGWCRKMDTSLVDPVCKDFFDKNYVIDHLVVLESKGKESLENPGGMDYMKKWGGAESGLPFWVILDDKGEVIANSMRKSDSGKLDNVGCPASEPEVKHFVEVLQKTSKLTADQLAVISKRFRQNELQ